MTAASAKLNDFSNFIDVQTKTAWGRTLSEFASFCAPSIGSPVPAALARAGRRLQPASVTLDIGCGPGLLPGIFARQGHTAFGIDSDFSLLSSFLSPNLAQADAFHLPFEHSTFDLVTATNVLFLLPDPLLALREWSRLLAPDGDLCLLNPSENLNIPAARQLADQRGLASTARSSLLNWAKNAESHFRWTEAEMRDLLSQAGLQFAESALRVGSGFARFVRSRVH